MGNCFSTDSGGHHASAPSPGIPRLTEAPVVSGLNSENIVPMVPLDLGHSRPLPDPTESTPSSIKVFLFKIKGNVSEIAHGLKEIQIGALLSPKCQQL